MNTSQFKLIDLNCNLSLKEQKMRIFFVSVLFLIINLCYSQSSQVTIIGDMPQHFGGEYVSFCKPIGKYSATALYIKSKDTAVLNNNKFIKKLDISGSGLIYVYEKPFNGTIATRFFAEPGDTVFIERQDKEIVFKGKNAIVNKMYSDVKIAPVGFSDEIFEIFKKCDNSDKIIKKINELEGKHLKIYTDLYHKKLISKSCLEYTKTLMMHSIDGYAMDMAKADEFREEQKMPITKEEANKFVNHVVLKYIPYKAENMRSHLFARIIGQSAIFLEEKSIKENKTVPRFWNQYDEIFKSKSKNFGVIDYIEFNDYKETYIGQVFLSLIKSYDNEKTIKFKDLIAVYKSFVEKFPNSPYIIPISESIMDKALDNLNTNATSANPATIAKVESKIKTGNLAIYNTLLEPVSNAPFAQPNQSFTDALAEKFTNQDVFIDLWATWCGPCLKQFPYNKELHAFLETKNIKTLYVSFDKEEEITKWEKYIQDYSLVGYHFLANKAYQEKFLNPLGEYIPRYFVYNSKTKKLQLLEGYPSEKEKFYTTIAKALK